MRRGRLLIGVVATALILASLPGATGAAGPVSVSIGDVSVTEPSQRNGTVGIELPVTVHGGTASAITSAGRRSAAAPDSRLRQPVARWSSLPARPGARSPSRSGPTVRPNRPRRSVSGSRPSPARARPIPAARSRSDRRAQGSASATSSSSSRMPGSSGSPCRPRSGVPEQGRLVQLATPIRQRHGRVDAPAASGTGTIPKGGMGTLVRDPGAGDTVVEPDETLELVVTSVTNTSLSDGLGVVTLRNTDARADRRRPAYPDAHAYPYAHAHADPDADSDADPHTDTQRRRRTVRLAAPGWFDPRHRHGHLPRKQSGGLHRPGRHVSVHTGGRRDRRERGRERGRPVRRRRRGLAPAVQGDRTRQHRGHGCLGQRGSLSVREPRPCRSSARAAAAISCSDASSSTRSRTGTA